MTNDKSIGVIILAGGNSSRMNFPKPWLEYSEDVSFLEHIINQYYSANIKKITVVLNENFIEPNWSEKIERVKEKATIVANNEAHRGRFHSLKLGIVAGEISDHLFIHNVDNPNINFELLNELNKNKLDAGITVPQFEEKNGHPIIISRAIQNDILAEKKDDIILSDLLKKYKKKCVNTTNEFVLTNINTPEDYLKARREFVY